jgi:hypothetical protein
LWSQWNDRGRYGKGHPGSPQDDRTWNSKDVQPEWERKYGKGYLCGAGGTTEIGMAGSILREPGNKGKGMAGSILREPGNKGKEMARSIPGEPGNKGKGMAGRIPVETVG